MGSVATVHIMAAMAEYEAKAISARTKAALAAAKARGTQLGGLRWDITSVCKEGRKMALETRQESAAKWRDDILPVIRQKQLQGATTLQAVADALNAENLTARRGGPWTATQVQRLLDQRAM